MSDEIRTTSSTGGDKGVKPERFSLIPKAPLDLLGQVYDFGTKKYAPHNYRRGYEWSKSYDALQRHLTAWWERDEIDPESGLSHLGHAAWHIFALIVFSSDPKYKQFDDRYGADEFNLNEHKTLITDGSQAEFDERVEDLISREEAYGPYGAAIVNRLLDEDFDIQSNSSKILLEDTPWPRLSQDEPGLILVTPEEFDHMCPSFLDENSTVKEVDTHVQAGRITPNQAEAWARRYHGRKAKSDVIHMEIDGRKASIPRDAFESGTVIRNWVHEQTRIMLEEEMKTLPCVWIETLTPDGRAWICHTHNWLTRSCPAQGEPCGAVGIEKSSEVNEHAICYYEDASHPESLVCLEHGQTSKYGTSRGPNRACQAVDPWVPGDNRMPEDDRARDQWLSKEGVSLLPKDERPFVHPNGDKVACDYDFVRDFGVEKPVGSGYYYCKIHESRTNRHPSEGANRPCSYIDPTNGDWGNVIPPPGG